MRKIFFRTVAILALAIILTWIFFLFFFGIIPPVQTEPALTWNGITPGRSTSDDVIVAFGNPISIENRENYVVYKYPPFEGWESVEVWLENQEQDNQLIVLGIYLDQPAFVDGKTLNPVYLMEIIQQYGLPEKVTWAGWCRTRAVIWGKKGLMVNADANIRHRTWDEYTVGSILIAKPMSTRRFMFFPWPWGFSLDIMNYNPCKGPAYSPPDNLPEDPYDWDHMPTPPATVIP